MSDQVQQTEIVKWYTRARKFPQLIGKTPDGARIWGGPYTYTQVVTAAGVLVIGVNTVDVWGRFGLIGNAMILLGGTYGLVIAIGRVPIGSRNPLSAMSGLLRALSTPQQGTCAGRQVRIRRPHRLSTHFVTSSSPARHLLAHDCPTAASPQLAAPPTGTRHSQDAHPLPAARHRSAPDLTAVQRLLASPTTNRKD